MKRKAPARSERTSKLSILASSEGAGGADLGAIAIVVPGLPLLKEWAYAGFFFELSGAAASHALAADGPSQIVQPLVFLALVVASWWLRPAGRRIAP
jgi:hypothetical protein